MPPSSSDITHDGSDKGLTGRRGDILTSYNQSVKKRRPAGHTSFGGQSSDFPHHYSWHSEFSCVKGKTYVQALHAISPPTWFVNRLYWPSNSDLHSLVFTCGAETHKYQRLIGPATSKGTRKIHSTTNQRWKYKLGRKPASISNCFSMACHIEISRHFLPICWRDFVAKIVGRPSDGFRSMRVCITGNNQWPTSSILDIHLIIDLRIRKERRNRP
jgi:hypothetical protein